MLVAVSMYSIPIALGNLPPKVPASLWVGVGLLCQHVGVGWGARIDR